METALMSKFLSPHNPEAINFPILQMETLGPWRTKPHAQVAEPVKNAGGIHSCISTLAL